MSNPTSVEIVETFWDAVWNAHDPDAIDRFVVDDFVITSGGEDVVSKESFKEWVGNFLEKINDLHLEVIESFQNEDGSRVASSLAHNREKQRGARHGGRPAAIAFTGTAVWAVREDGKLLHNWVERASWELFQRLTGE